MKKLQYIWLAVVLALPGSILAENGQPILIGYGRDAKWSPSGRFISIVVAEGIQILNRDSLRTTATLAVSRPWLYHWVNDDTLAAFFKEYTDSTQQRTSVRVGINCLLPLKSGLIEISRDTAFSPIDYQTPWQRLPDGTIGIFQVEQGVRAEFFRLEGVRLIPDAADTSLLAECNRRFAFVGDQVEVTPSRRCSHAFALRLTDGSAVLIDSLGHELCLLGTTPSQVARDRFRYLVFPNWSYSGNYLTLQEEIEDGHTTFLNDILLVNVATCEVNKITDLKECGASSVDWSPIRDEFLYVEDCSERVLVVRLGH